MSCCFSQKACLTVEENIRLKSRLQAAEADTGPRQASSAEQDYEEVIQLLEAEIRDLKNQLGSKWQARGVEAKVSLQQALHCPCFMCKLCPGNEAITGLYAHLIAANIDQISACKLSR